MLNWRYIKIQSVPRSKHAVSVVRTSQLMLYREIIAVVLDGKLVYLCHFAIDGLWTVRDVARACLRSEAAVGLASITQFATHRTPTDANGETNTG
jgi:hypothetical protein